MEFRFILQTRTLHNTKDSCVNNNKDLNLDNRKKLNVEMKKRMLKLKSCIKEHY